MKRIYVAGPMTDLPEFNYPLFHRTARMLRDQGYWVENPAENPPPSCGTWLGWMRLGIAQLVTCDAIYILPGWQNSEGAYAEFMLAKLLKIEIQFAPILAGEVA